MVGLSLELESTLIKVGFLWGSKPVMKAYSEGAGYLTVTSCLDYLEFNSNYGN